MERSFFVIFFSVAVAVVLVRFVIAAPLCETDEINQFFQKIDIRRRASPVQYYAITAIYCRFLGYQSVQCRANGQNSVAKNLDGTSDMA
jgi:hypothetical protein